MLKNVALVALLSAPAALAFAPSDITGVWHCVPAEGRYFVNDQSPTQDIQWKNVDSTSSSRVVVFDKGDKSNTRFFTGRSYYTVGSNTEEHGFHGHFTNALHADFYYDPNLKNAECDNSLADFTTDPIGAFRYGNGEALGPTDRGDVSGNWEGHCSDYPSGPNTLAMEDIDHFFLTLDTHVKELNYYSKRLVAQPSGGKSWQPKHVFVVEKCMRGLPEKNEKCDNLKHSQIDTSSEMDDACQGTLVCTDIDSKDTSKGKQCTIPPTPAPYSYVPQPYYQPQYYQPQYYQPQQQYMWG